MFHDIINRYCSTINTDWSYRTNYLPLRDLGLYRSQIEYGECQTANYRRRQLRGNIQAGQTLQLQGVWGEHAQYGSQFQVVQYQETKPATLTGIEKYLGSGLIKGVGPVTAKRIVKHFGLDT